MTVWAGRKHSASSDCPGRFPHDGCRHPQNILYHITKQKLTVACRWHGAWEARAMARRFSGRTVLIFGASLGIGRAIAEAFAREGCAVMIADVLEAPGHALAA